MDGLGEVFNSLIALILTIKTDSAVVVAECVVWLECESLRVIVNGLIDFPNFIVGEATVKVGLKMQRVLI